MAWARHQPEAEMLLGMLRELASRPGSGAPAAWTCPDMLAGGPRELLVPADRALEAHALLDPFEGLPDEE